MHSSRANSPPGIRHAGRAARERAPAASALGALVLAVAWSPCCSCAATAAAPVQAALRERRPARQGRRRAGRRPARSARSRKIKLTDDNQAAITITVAGRLRAAARGHARRSSGSTSLSGIANRYIALTPGPERQPASSPTAATLGTDNDDVDRRPRPALQHARPEDAQGAAEVIQGYAHVVRGQRGAQANAATKYFNPRAERLAPAGQRARRRPADAQRASSRNAAPDDGRPRRAPRRPRGPGRQREHDRGRDRRRERVARPGARRCCPTRCARPTRRSSTCARRSTTSTCSSPRPSRRRRTSRRSCASCARSCSDARPTIPDLSTLVHRSGPEQRPDRRCSARRRRSQKAAKPVVRAARSRRSRRPQPVHRVHPALHARLRRLAARLRRGRANYDANGHYARIQPIFNAFRSPRTRRGTLTPIPPRQRLAGLQTSQVRRCPGAAIQAPPDGSAPFRDADGTLDCDPSLVPPGP